MTDYSNVISQIQKSSSLATISQIVETYSAEATGPDGILYSGFVGNTSAHQIAIDIFNSSAQKPNIIDNTARGLLLADPMVEAAIMNQSQAILEQAGQPADVAARSAISFLVGDPLVASGPTSIGSCLWGQASSEFVASLSP